ncbi:MAG TPA: M28 family metallopeptidase [bacterium]|nr:M28 family metallopeptidase [bacterium]
MPSTTSADQEQALCDAVSPTKLMQFTRGVAKWVRLSGSEDEAKAFDYVEETLRGFDLDVRRETHDALVSWPISASLETIGQDGAGRVQCITHAFAASTPREGLEAEVVDAGPSVAGHHDMNAGSLRGKIALIDGLAMPAKARAAEDAGALGAIFINPAHLHEMIISSVWGAPTPETVGALPKLVAVSVKESDGAVLRARAREGGLQVRIHADVDTRWRKTPLLTADLTGREDRYVLFSGHIDSWHYGAMDNGSANAVMLEIARLLSRRRKRLRRGVRFAFWSGHSHGRYSGSTWYADTHWQDLHRRAVLHLNVDSSGAQGATVLGGGLTMAETWALAADCVRLVARQDLERRRVTRMGDQSFWGIGLPSLFVGVSEQPAGDSAGGPPIGGLAGRHETKAAGAALASLSGGPASGGLGWWWHTTEDTMDKIDKDNLARDAQIYARALWRWCTAPVLPLDYRATAAEFRETLGQIRREAGDVFDFGPALAAADRLAAAAEALQTKAAALSDTLAHARGTRRQRDGAEAINTALMRAGRALIPVNYTVSGPFDHDRALPVAPIPSLQPASRLGGLPEDSMERHALATRLLRERNKVTHALETAAEVFEDTLARIV